MPLLCVVGTRKLGPVVCVAQGNIDGRACNGGGGGGGGGERRGSPRPFQSAWYKLNLSMHGYSTQ